MAYTHQCPIFVTFINIHLSIHVHRVKFTHSSVCRLLALHNASSDKNLQIKYFTSINSFFFTQKILFSEFVLNIYYRKQDFGHLLSIFIIVPLFLLYISLNNPYSRGMSDHVVYLSKL